MKKLFCRSLTVSKITTEDFTNSFGKFSIGLDERRRNMFGRYGEPVIGIDRPLPPRELKEAEVLDLLETMTPFPNKDQLAQELAEKNKKKPGRYGAGATTIPAMRKYILRAENKMKKGSPNLHLLLEDRRRHRIEEAKAAARRRLRKPKPGL
jgi:hypothetical protein